MIVNNIMYFILGLYSSDNEFMSLQKARFSIYIGLAGEQIAHVLYNKESD